MKLELSVSEGRVRITAEGRPLGELCYALRKGKNRLLPAEIKTGDGNSVTAAFNGVGVRDILEAEQGLIRVRRSWKIARGGKWQLLFGYMPVQGLDRWVVPAVMYGKNEMGEGKFPRGGIEQGWSFREDRIPIPSCSILHNDKEWQAVFAAPAGQEGETSSVKTFREGENPAFEISVPYVEEPYTYTEKGVVLGGLTGRTEKYFNVSSVPFEYNRTFYIAYGGHKHPSNIFTILVARAMDEFSEGEAAQADWSEIAALKLQHLKYLLLDGGGITAIKQGRGNGLFQSYYEFTSGSFLCKSLEAACIFVRWAAGTGNEQYLDLAERIGDFFLQGSRPDGQHRDCYSLKTKEWGGYLGVGTPPELARGCNARCNGEVMVNYLRLYRLLKNAGRQRKEFLKIAESNAQFYLQHQLSGDQDGSFGRWWDTDGRPLNKLGTNGAYIISLLIELEKLTGRSDEIDNALERAARYYTALVDRDGFYADTLDADCVDKEAGCSLLRAFLDLYERSRDEQYLKYAVRAAGFTLSWMFTYNVAFSPHSMLGKRGFRTQGMTAVSVAHHHLDFYGMLIAFDLLRLWEATGEAFWKRCALLMIGACGQLVAGKKDMLGKGRDFIGWQPEQVNQTNWDYKLRYLGTKGRFHTCVAWTVVLTLGAMLDIRERFPDMLKFRVG